MIYMTIHILISVHNVCETCCLLLVWRGGIPPPDFRSQYLFDHYYQSLHCLIYTFPVGYYQTHMCMVCLLAYLVFKDYTVQYII